MSRILTVLVLVLITGALTLARPAGAETPLEEAMTASELSASGLHKLTPEELRFLNDWLRSRNQTVAIQGAEGEAVVVGESAVEAAAITTGQAVSVESQSVSITPVATAEIRLNVADTSAGGESADNPEQSRPVTDAESFGEEQLRQRPAKEAPVAITARLKGEFRGWNGKTIFYLNNGQVWQQRVGGRYRSPKRMTPEVIIERGRFGYYLKLAETGRMVGVKRIK